MIRHSKTIANCKVNEKVDECMKRKQKYWEGCDYDYAGVGEATCSSVDDCGDRGAKWLPVPMAMLVRSSSQRVSNASHRLSSKTPNAQTFCHTPKTINVCLTNVCTVKVSASSLANAEICDRSCSNADGGGRGNTDLMKRSIRLL